MSETPWADLKNLRTGERCEDGGVGGHDDLGGAFSEELFQDREEAKASRERERRLGFVENP